MRNPIELPAPDVVALAHSERVRAHIGAEIRAAGGWIDFARYMDLALYAPGLGYYSAGATKFGTAGDFVTAPEISPLFGRCLARAIAPWLTASPGRVIVEVGAGSGALAADILLALRGLGAPAVPYLILEVSGQLRERQRATLAGHAGADIGRVRWLEQLPATPLEAVILANEVADALPVSRFEITPAGLREHGVAQQDESLAWSSRAASAPLAGAVAALERSLGAAFATGYVSETSLRLPAWLAALASSMRRGMLVLIDYGGSRHEVFHAHRRAGTLICHYRHRAHADPFLWPGLQDITAWVDFTAVAEAGASCGLDVAGYTTQAHFLMAAGMEAELRAAAGAGGAPPLALAQQAKTLLMPGEMGERFKVMVLTREADAPPGFELRDLRHRL